MAQATRHRAQPRSRQQLHRSAQSGQLPAARFGAGADVNPGADPDTFAMLHEAQPEPNQPQSRVNWQAYPEPVSTDLDDAQSPAREAPRLPPHKTRSDDQDFLAEQTEKLIDNLRLMKRTRFNGQGRLEAKHTASVAAFTLATIFEIGLSLAGTSFSTTMTAQVASFIEFASQITAVFILGFGLVAGLSNYQTKAIYLQRCAMDWGSLSRELQIARPVSRDELQDFRRRYHEIEAKWPENHADVDYRKAQLQRRETDTCTAGERASALRGNRLDYFVSVYLVYAVTGIGYICFFTTGLLFALS